MAARDNSRPECLFLAVPSSFYQQLRGAISAAAKEAGFRLKSPTDVNAIQMFETAAPLADAILRADVVVAEVTNANPNIAYELGIAHASGKPVVLLTEERHSGGLILQAVPYITYERSSEGLKTLHDLLSQILLDLRKFPRRFTSSFLPLRNSSLPFIELERLEPREFENLCFELLTQMGLRRMEWGTDLRGIDAIGTLRKKDPDNFEYQELWLISMGIRMPLEMALEAASDPELLTHRILSRREAEEINFGPTTPITFLFIPYPHGEDSEQMERSFRHFDRRYRERPYGRIRLRLWNKEHLVNLIQQYPQLAHKYFSDEGRAQSSYRKTADEMYEENVRLLERQQALNAALQEEKDKRTTAERDAVWKELSFTAAHKLGNPIFALETDLEGLKRRIANSDDAGAAKVAEEMGSSVEKAKQIIEQFKSLTKAQEIAPRPVNVIPLLEAACRVAEQNGIEVEITHPSHVPELLADPDRMTECFDELVANSLHWFNKSARKLLINIEMPTKKEVPEGLSGNHTYLRIRFSDNGCGVPLDLKRKIFDPFFTTHPHGTGLGLSLVERIIQGHHGSIAEKGEPETGATFEIYLPVTPRRRIKEQ